MKIKKLTEHIGAEISEIRIDSLGQSEVDEIKEAWLAHKVLVFRNQPISVEAHIAFGNISVSLKFTRSRTIWKIILKLLFWKLEATLLDKIIMPLKIGI